MSRQYSGYCIITTMVFSHGAGKLIITKEIIDQFIYFRLIFYTKRPKKTLLVLSQLLSHSQNCFSNYVTQMTCFADVISYLQLFDWISSRYWFFIHLSTLKNWNNTLFPSRYYPFHYAPYLSDICNISELKIHLDLGKPFMPFEQLLAVLPAASKDLLPKCYQVGCNILIRYWYVQGKNPSFIFMWKVTILLKCLTFLEYFNMQLFDLHFNIIDR